MSTIDNQQAVRKKRRKRNPQENAPIFKKIGFFLLAVPARGVRNIFRFAHKNPRATLGVVAAVCVVGLLWSAKQSLVKYADRKLPHTVVLDVVNTDLRIRVRNLTEKALSDARARNLSRAEFMRKIGSTLEDIDLIDDYWVRSGLDGRVQIRATTQIPILVLEGANNDRYLIGHRLKIMAKNFPDTGYPGVMRISAPELRIQNPSPKQSLANKGAHNRVLRGGASATMNFSWLASQGQRIRSAFIERRNGYSLEKMSWRSAQGFALLLKGTETPATEAGTAPKAQLLNVVLGESDIPKKLEKLSNILEDLSSRQLMPENIDLNFHEKALIKLSESGTNVAL